MPNRYPIRTHSDEPYETAPMIARWCWSKAMHHYGFGLLYPGPGTAAAAGGPRVRVSSESEVH
ncbi:MAG: hypothetical protein CME06_00490 [Gemmatimonadetes bacterium]|nr:hypothetical protein [Gemmatimonadota bacterium]